MQNTENYNNLSNDEESSDDDASFSRFKKKCDKHKGKRGRKCLWAEAVVTDLVDIILENEKYKKKLLMTNTKNVKNGIYYTEVIHELTERCKDRGEDFMYDVAQTRSKFKRCVSLCRNAALTIKTASGIKRFQEEKEFGPWFQKLYQVVCTMDNCQPEQAIEAAAQMLAGSNDDLEECNDAEPEFAVPSSTSSGQTTTADSDQGTSKEDAGKKRRRSSKVFVPINKNNAKKQVLEKSLETLSKTLQDVSEAVKDNGTVVLVNFLKEDAERQERREMKDLCACRHLKCIRLTLLVILEIVMLPHKVAKVFICMGPEQTMSKVVALMFLIVF